MKIAAIISRYLLGIAFHLIRSQRLPALPPQRQLPRAGHAIRHGAGRVGVRGFPVFRRAISLRNPLPDQPLHSPGPDAHRPRAGQHPDLPHSYAPHRHWPRPAMRPSAGSYSSLQNTTKPSPASSKPAHSTPSCRKARRMQRCRLMNRMALQKEYHGAFAYWWLGHLPS